MISSCIYPAVRGENLVSCKNLCSNLLYMYIYNKICSNQINPAVLSWQQKEESLGCPCELPYDITISGVYEVVHCKLSVTVDMHDIK